MKKGVFSPVLQRFCVRSIVAALFVALVLWAAENNPAVGDWISNQLHTSLDISYFLK